MTYIFVFNTRLQSSSDVYIFSQHVTPVVPESSLRDVSESQSEGRPDHWRLQRHSVYLGRWRKHHHQLCQTRTWCKNNNVVDSLKICQRTFFLEFDEIFHFILDYLYEIMKLVYVCMYFLLFSKFEKKMLKYKRCAENGQILIKINAPIYLWFNVLKKKSWVQYLLLFCLTYFIHKYKKKI